MFWHVLTMNSGHQNLEDLKISMSQISSSRTSESSSSGACGMMCQLDPSGTLWWTNTLLLKMAIEIVDFPMKNGGSFHCFLYVHQRVHQIVADMDQLDHLGQLGSLQFLGWQSQHASILCFEGWRMKAWLLGEPWVFDRSKFCVWTTFSSTAAAAECLFCKQLKVGMEPCKWIFWHHFDWTSISNIWRGHVAAAQSQFTTISWARSTQTISNSLQSTMPVTLIPAVWTQVGSSKAGKVRSALGQFTHAGDQTWGAGSLR